MTFSYTTLRFLVGVVALILSPIVVLFSSEILPSISYSYFTASRDIFVGLLFFISAFLFSYNGHSSKESILSKLAALGAIGTAIFPTALTSCNASIPHLISAISLFLILIYFSYVVFRTNTKDMGGKRELRSNIYLTSSIVMIICVIGMTLSIFLLDCQTVWDTRIIFWGECIALVAFGISWVVSGKNFSFIADEDELNKLFK